MSSKAHFLFKKLKRHLDPDQDHDIGRKKG